MCAVRVVSEESRRTVLPKTSCLSLKIVGHESKFFDPSDKVSRKLGLKTRYKETDLCLLNSSPILGLSAMLSIVHIMYGWMIGHQLHN